MKKFVLMHMGFEKPTPEIMAKWGEWFESIADKTVENLGFRSGREITGDGTEELSMNRDSITGVSIVNAETIEEAEEMARRCPYIKAIRVYEVMSH